MLERIHPYSPIPGLLDGRVIISIGYAYDAVEGNSLSQVIQFILPEGGGVLWIEHFAISASSAHPREAEALLNYLLEPQVMAEISNANHYAPAHDGALKLIDAVLRDNPPVFPPNDILSKAEIIIPISDAAEQSYQAAWKAFIATFPTSDP